MDVTVRSTGVTEVQHLSLIIRGACSGRMHTKCWTLLTPRMEGFCSVISPSRWHSDFLLAVACGDLALEGHYSLSSAPSLRPPGGTPATELPKALLDAACRDQLTPC